MEHEEERAVHFGNAGDMVNLAARVADATLAEGSTKITKETMTRAFEELFPEVKTPWINRVLDTALRGDVEQLEELLDTPRRKRLKNKKGQKTPLHSACEAASMACVELLVNKGADWTAVWDSEGVALTPFIWAVQQNNVTFVYQLLERYRAFGLSHLLEATTMLPAVAFAKSSAMLTMLLEYDNVFSAMQFVDKGLQLLSHLVKMVHIGDGYADHDTATATAIRAFWNYSQEARLYLDRDKWASVLPNVDLPGCESCCKHVIQALSNVSGMDDGAVEECCKKRSDTAAHVFPQSQQLTSVTRPVLYETVKWDDFDFAVKFAGKTYIHSRHLYEKERNVGEIGDFNKKLKHLFEVIPMSDKQAKEWKGVAGLPKRAGLDTVRANFIPIDKLEDARTHFN